MLPTFHQTDLPQSEQLWEKVRADLAQGFKIHGIHPHYNDIIRSYTRNTDHNWQFLLIASANQTNPPVFALELNVYPPRGQTWRLILNHTPIPTPRWDYQWQSSPLEDDESPQPTREQINHIIQIYLTSQFDPESTRAAYKRLGYSPNRVTWATENNR